MRLGRALSSIESIHTVSEYLLLQKIDTLENEIVELKNRIKMLIKPE